MKCKNLHERRTGVTRAGLEPACALQVVAGEIHEPEPDGCSADGW